MWRNLRLRATPDTFSIRSRLIAYLSAGFAIGLVALYWAANSYGRFAADGSYDRLLSGSASSIAETLSITPESVRVDIPYAALDMLAAAPNDKVFYRVVDMTGHTVTGYSDLPAGPSADTRSFADKPVQFFDASYRGDPVRFVLLGREARIAGHSGWVLVQVGQTRLARAAMARELTLRAIVPIIGMALLFLAVIWFGVGRSLRPLESIGRDLRARDHSDFSRIGVGVPQEVEPMVSALNGFMGRLDTSFAFLRTFIATTAHQLRTPLTALIVQISSAETSSGQQRTANVEAANKSARKLARLLDQLLSDALVEHRSVLRRFQKVDLKAIVEQAIRDTVQLSLDSDLRFTTTLSSADVSGDEVMLAEAIKNIVHNAILHGYGDEGTVEISLSAERGGYAVQVADRGAGIDDATAAALAERFKSGDGDNMGAGLGVAIAKQVAESHGGHLSWANRDGGGAQFIMWVPCA